MRLIDEQYTARPFYGSRRMTIWLNEQGEEVNRKRVQRLMRVMGLEAIYPKPRLSPAGKGHRIYPYLLRGVTVGRRDQVWSTDITYGGRKKITGPPAMRSVVEYRPRSVLEAELWRSPSHCATY